MFRKKVIQCIIFMLIMTVFFTIGQQVDFFDQEYMQYHHLIGIFFGWCACEVYFYFKDKK